MIITLCGAFPQKVKAEEIVSFTVNVNKSELAKGDLVTYTVEMSQNLSGVGLDLEFIYDDTMLELQEAKIGKIFESATIGDLNDTSSGKIHAVIISIGMLENGTVFTATFKVKDEAKGKLNTNIGKIQLLDGSYKEVDCNIDNHTASVKTSVITPSTGENPSTEEKNPSTEEQEPSTEEKETDTEEEITEFPEDSTINWKSDEKGIFYEKEDGSRIKGWYEIIKNEWYYFDENGYRQTSWIKDAEKWYYLNENGIMQTSWIKDVGKWYYLNENGAMQTGWIKDKGDWYYLSENGAMKTGWLKEGATWYYLSESGAMKTGWLKDEKAWYYLNESGAMKTGWLKEGATWYYLSENGAMKTGWLKDGNTWYYLSENGAMQTGWIQLGTDWFYLNADGSMATDTYIGNWYVDKNGYYIP